jgi:hypothetical protein
MDATLRAVAKAPQWSLPAGGGSIPKFLDGHGYFFEPQWSPPLTGGNSLFFCENRLVTSQPRWGRR